jgi:hypothetical protein
MKKIVRLTESDLVRLVKMVLMEQSTPTTTSKINTAKGNQTPSTYCERNLLEAGVELPLKNADYKKMVDGIRNNDHKYFKEWKRATDNAYNKETDAKKKSAISGYRICISASMGQY